MSHLNRKSSPWSDATDGSMRLVPEIGGCACRSLILGIQFIWRVDLRQIQLHTHLTDHVEMGDQGELKTEMLLPLEMQRFDRHRMTLICVAASDGLISQP